MAYQYKATYTQEEVEELGNWFETHTYENSLDLGEGLSIADVHAAIPPMLHTARTKYANRNFSGPIALLFRIREELIRQNKVKEQPQE